MLAHTNLPLESLITHRFPLDKLQDAFDLLTKPRNQAIKALIKI